MGEDSYRRGCAYKTNLNQIQPTSLLAVVFFSQMCQPCLTNSNLALSVALTSLQCLYLWASSPAAAWHWWSGGWAAGRRAASATRPPLCECAACPRSWRAGAQRSLPRRHSRCLCCHLQDGRGRQNSVRGFPLCSTVHWRWLQHCKQVMEECMENDLTVKKWRGKNLGLRYWEIRVVNNKQYPATLQYKIRDKTTTSLTNSKYLVNWNVKS